MTKEPDFYAIYDADGSFMGEVRYLRDKCLGKAECALCDLSHGWNPLGRPDWRRSGFQPWDRSHSAHSALPKHLSRR